MAFSQSMAEIFYAIYMWYVYVWVSSTSLPSYNVGALTTFQSSRRVLSFVDCRFRELCLLESGGTQARARTAPRGQLQPAGSRVSSVVFFAHVVMLMK